LLNHTIADAQSARGVLGCADCHENTSRMDLKGQLGYGLKSPESTTCSQGEAKGCHGSESWQGNVAGHRKHVTEEKLDCINCHTFSRPERGLRGAVSYPAAAGTLSGTVSSAGSPLVGVTVAVPGHAAMTTASDGTYTLAGVAPGTYSVTYSKPGYGTQTLSVAISSGAPTTSNVSLAAGSTMTPIYRFYNKKNGSHFYTASAAEKDSVVANLSAIYRFEGVAYHVGSDYPVPLHRFYNKKSGSHFYTASEAEKDSVSKNLSATYTYEGPAYYVSASAMAGTTPVWRFYNKKNGSHFYTASAAEKGTVAATMRATYVLDGLAFHVAP